MPASFAPFTGDLDHLSAADVSALLQSARMLVRSRLERPSHQALKGRNVGLVCDESSGEPANLFRRAATRLGAHVSLLAVESTSEAARDARRQTALLLGRLYDAIECQSMAQEIVVALGRAAGVPVYHGLATPEHPTASLATLLDEVAPEERRELIVQAVLLSTIRSH